MTSSKLLGCSLSFQISGGFVESLGEIILFLGTVDCSTSRTRVATIAGGGGGRVGECKLVISCEDREMRCTYPLLPGPCVLAAGERMAYIIHWLQASCGALTEFQVNDLAFWKIIFLDNGVLGKIRKSH